MNKTIVLILFLLLNNMLWAWEGCSFWHAEKYNEINDPYILNTLVTVTQNYLSTKAISWDNSDEFKVFDLHDTQQWLIVQESKNYYTYIYLKKDDLSLSDLRLPPSVPCLAPEEVTLKSKYVKQPKQFIRDVKASFGSYGVNYKKLRHPKISDDDQFIRVEFKMSISKNISEKYVFFIDKKNSQAYFYQCANGYATLLTYN